MLVVDVAIIKFFRIVYIVLKKILFNFLLFIVVSFFIHFSKILTLHLGLVSQIDDILLGNKKNA